MNTTSISIQTRMGQTKEGEELEIKKEKKITEQGLKGWREKRVGKKEIGKNLYKFKLNK